MNEIQKKLSKLVIKVREIKSTRRHKNFKKCENILDACLEVAFPKNEIDAMGEGTLFLDKIEKWNANALVFENVKYHTRDTKWLAEYLKNTCRVKKQEVADIAKVNCAKVEGIRLSDITDYINSSMNFNNKRLALEEKAVVAYAEARTNNVDFATADEIVLGKKDISCSVGKNPLLFRRAMIQEASSYFGFEAPKVNNFLNLNLSWLRLLVKKEFQGEINARGIITTRDIKELEREHPIANLKRMMSQKKAEQSFIAYREDRFFCDNPSLGDMAKNAKRRVEVARLAKNCREDFGNYIDVLNKCKNLLSKNQDTGVEI